METTTKVIGKRTELTEMVTYRMKLWVFISFFFKKNHTLAAIIFVLKNSSFFFSKLHQKVLSCMWMETDTMANGLTINNTEWELNNKKILSTMGILNSGSSKARGKSHGKMTGLHMRVISLKDSCREKESFNSLMGSRMLDNGLDLKCMELDSCIILMARYTQVD